jgi:DNA (cytosine-5)-methyltransferase 1
MMNELALFAGGGGGLLGSLLLGWRTVCYVERDLYAVDIIKARIADGLLHVAPIWDDVTTFDGRPWTGQVDIVTGGFPCQPFSGAGRQQGEDDGRNCWPDTLRIIRQVRPEWCLLENVSALLTFDYFGTILGELAESGYRVRWDCIPASALGAPNRRDRLWICAHANERTDGQQYGHAAAGHDLPGTHTKLADAENAGLAGGQRLTGDDTDAREGGPVGRTGSGTNAGREAVADTNGSNGYGRGLAEQVGRIERPQETQDYGIGRGVIWSAEPDLPRVAYGVAHRMDRLRAVGNGQVPAVVRAAWLALSEGL